MNHVKNHVLSEQASETSQDYIVTERGVQGAIGQNFQYFFVLDVDNSLNKAALDVVKDVRTPFTCNDLCHCSVAAVILPRACVRNTSTSPQ